MKKSLSSLLLMATLSAPTSLLAFEKPTNWVDLKFAPGSAQLATTERVELIRMLEKIKEHWCPLEGMVASAHFDASETTDSTAGAALAKKRADEVVKELIALGVPSSLVYSESGKYVSRPLPWSGIVEVEAVGGSYQMPCPYPQSEQGFHVQERR